jgi:DNA repair ATPase RecN
VDATDRDIRESDDGKNNNVQEIEMDELDLNEVQNAETSSGEQENASNYSVKIISKDDVYSMLNAIQNDDKTKKSWDISVEEFGMKFKDANSINKNFTKADLVVCMQPIDGKLKAVGVKCGSSLPKPDLVTIMSKYLGVGTIIHHKKAQIPAEGIPF